MGKKSFAYFLCILLVVALSGHLFPRDNVTWKKVYIEANLGWQDSGVRLKSEQYYSVKASGSWVSGWDVDSHGPEGNGDGTLVNGALLGWIANKKPERLGYKSFTRKIVSRIVYIGEGGMRKSNGDGKLWLAMGEWSGCKECSGKVEVLITVYE